MSILQFKTANCKNCYKCVRYCPVKSIKVENHQAKIIEQDCILCGNCTTVCPQNAKEDISDIPKIKAVMTEKKLVAAVAPSFSAYFGGCGLADMSNALKTLGFFAVRETAEGAYIVKSRYEKDELSAGDEPVISSCCATVDLLIEKYYPLALKYLSPIQTPMQVHSQLLRREYPEAAIVFISPCISKKSECSDGIGADYCITFDELEDWFAEAGVNIEQSQTAEKAMFTRQFPMSGGVLGSMKKTAGRSYLFVDGIEKCRSALDEIISGGLRGCFVEMNACEGGCIGGPSFRRKKMSGLTSRLVTEKAAGDDYSSDFNIDYPYPIDRELADMSAHRRIPGEKQIQGILKKMGKLTPADELNCGMCGYSSCREKALAVYEGKAEISMCMPLMKERAETLSDSILSITPNAIIAVDMDLNISQINAAACRMFSVTPQQAAGMPVSEILDEFDFVEMIAGEKTAMTKHSYLAQYNIYIEQEFRFDKATGIVICIMKNITQSRQRHNNVMKAKVQAANMADEIVEKQLHVVHEIAALLGETAAETKAAVHNLKETIMMDSEDGGGDER